MDDIDLEVKCIVKNSVGNNSAEFRVEIQTAPRITDVQVWVNGVVKTDNKVELGKDREEDVTLRCIYTPSSAKIEWFKRVKGVDTSVFTGPYYSIVVKHTNNMDTYKCKASKTGQPTAESYAVLFLAYPVEATIEERSEDDGGKTITLTADGNPLHNGSSLDQLLLDFTYDYFADFRILGTALWFRTTINRDVRTGPLTRTAHS